MEVLAEAAMAAAGQSPVTLRQVEIVNGLTFSTDDPIDARITVTPDSGGYNCVLTYEMRIAKGGSSTNSESVLAASQT